MWEELGIAPTSDPREIRRAYALRLKGIDPDRDVDAFQRLRQAYENALAWSREGERRRSGPEHPRRRDTDLRSPRRDTAAAEAPNAVADVLPADADIDTAEKTAIIGALRQAIAGGATVRAFEQLIAASAKGLVSLAEEEELFVELMSLAMVDRGLSPNQFREMAHYRHWNVATRQDRGGDKKLRAEVLQRLETDERFRALVSQGGWRLGTSGSGALRDMVATRVAAERWYEELRAASSRRGFSDRARSEARVLLSRGRADLLCRHLLALIRVRMRPMRQLLAQYDLYHPWLDGRIDPTLAGALRAYLRINDPKFWSDPQRAALRGDDRRWRLKQVGDAVLLTLAVLAGSFALIAALGGLVTGAVVGVAIGLAKLFGG